MSTGHLALSARGVQMEYRDRASGEALLAIEEFIAARRIR